MNTCCLMPAPVTKHTYIRVTIPRHYNMKVGTCRYPTATVQRHSKTPLSGDGASFHSSPFGTEAYLNGGTGTQTGGSFRGDDRQEEEASLTWARRGSAGPSLGWRSGAGRLAPPRLYTCLRSAGGSGSPRPSSPPGLCPVVGTHTHTHTRARLR